MSEEMSFPIQVAEHEGHTLTIEVSDGRSPHGSPPGSLEVWLRRPPGEDGKPGTHMSDHAICRFFKNFDGDEEIAETQAERNELRTQIEEAKAVERELRKQIGQLNGKIKELERKVAKQRGDVVREVVETQVVALKAKLDTLPASVKEK